MQAEEDSDFMKFHSCSVCFEETLLPPQGLGLGRRVALGKEAVGYQCPESRDHVACYTCARTYLLTKFASKETAVSCLAPGCPRVLSLEEVKLFLRPSEFSAFEKRKRVNEDSRLKECPKCGALSKGSPSSPKIDCSSCHAEFCFFHGLGHVGKPCTAKHSFYDEVVTWMWHKVYTQSCPKCKHAIERNGGCSHMTCKCGFELCWNCGQSLHVRGARVYHREMLFPFFTFKGEHEVSCNTTFVMMSRLILILACVVAFLHREAIFAFLFKITTSVPLIVSYCYEGLVNFGFKILSLAWIHKGSFGLFGISVTYARALLFAWEKVTVVEKGYRSLKPRQALHLLLVSRPVRVAFFLILASLPWGLLLYYYSWNPSIDLMVNIASVGLGIGCGFCDSTAEDVLLYQVQSLEYLRVPSGGDSGSKKDSRSRRLTPTLAKKGSRTKPTIVRYRLKRGSFFSPSFGSGEPFYPTFLYFAVLIWLGILAALFYVNDEWKTLPSYYLPPDDGAAKNVSSSMTLSSPTLMTSSPPYSPSMEEVSRRKALMHDVFYCEDSRRNVNKFYPFLVSFGDVDDSFCLNNKFAKTCSGC